MKKLFGTDGVRGVAGQFPLRSADVLRLGWAAGRVLREKYKSKNCRVLLVRDPRSSGKNLSRSLNQGLRSLGIDVYDAGVLNTPSVAYLVKAHRFQSGVVISASHNPPEFNGIKFFTHLGRKWPDEWERNVESLFASSHPQLKENKTVPGSLVLSSSLADDYEEFVVKTLGENVSFSSFRLAVDCAHGANYQLAPEVLERLGAKVFVIGNRPNGKNINVGYGSQHLSKLRDVVLKRKCHVGVAFDGDGDRVIFIDEKGQTVDGDYTLAILAHHLKKQKRLKNNTVVTTVMANLGLRKFFEREKIRSLEVSVGDRYVSEGMRKSGAVLGGEQSGHIILGEFLPSGDGLLTAVHVLNAIRHSGKKLSVLAGAMKKYPQVLVNVRIKERIPLDKLNGVQKKIDRIENVLGRDGRILVRYSGTEPLLRIMLEGPEKERLNQFSDEIAQAVTKAAAERGLS